MAIDPMMSAYAANFSDVLLRRLLGGMSLFTLAILWLVHGMREGDRNIYWPCVGWIALNGAVVAGAVTYG